MEAAGLAAGPAADGEVAVGGMGAAGVREGAGGEVQDGGVGGLFNEALAPGNPGTAAAGNYGEVVVLEF